MKTVIGLDLPSNLQGLTDQRANLRFSEHWGDVSIRVDRIFAVLMAVQWLAGIAAALIISPRTWIGAASSTHLHVWAAILLGGAISALPIALVLIHPGRPLNRYVIAVAQGLWSALLIHLTGGHLETHFHVFASLAFLSLYRDWRVFVPATVVIAADHLLRGLFWPESVYGIADASAWRWLEHAGWVICEDIVLIVACVQSRREMRLQADQWAHLSITKDIVDAEVEAQTRELAETAEQVREREQKLSAVLNTAAEGIITANEQGIIESINKAATTIFGFAPEDVIGHNVTMLMPETFHGAHDGYLACLAQQSVDIGVAPREVTGRHRDGVAFPMSLAVSQIGTSSGRVFTAIMRDLTEEKRIRCDLAQSQRLESVGQLAAGIAHEINTPTQYIGDNTGFLKDAFAELDGVLTGCENLLAAATKGEVSPELLDQLAQRFATCDVDYLRKEIPSAIDQSLEGISTVTGIVRAMKEFSHPDSSEKVHINLNEAIATTITVSRSEWKYVADIHTQFDPHLPEVPCLAGPINQVFLNLIVNAAHAITAAGTKDGSDRGSIDISTHDADEWVETRVSDTGCGIPEEIRERVFDPFFTTKEVGKGTGQGLAISRSVVVDKHGGTIRFETEVGKGTTFIVRLPKAPLAHELGAVYQ